ncbi:MAG: potassium channel protein [Labilibaculum sp.]|nr:potassium channel protein [Labilibaculum sp.]MBI9059150.1 potassium channel protein [Labilibaculum sp.]|eukprot:TRINITY_DN185406_c0_g2_i1.p1 TRINITY_DN185406_c0_g2~~TRINITY_DN185406_c0_g2_i1.p1  ORF type:complete len:345 (-),score=39.06 TRINITY_DN185406_c0_g2_i1:180-1214(-)
MNKQKIWEENIRSLGIAMFSLVLAIVIGTGGYMLLNDAYSLVDAFYMTVITITTVGFTEVHPMTDAGKLFTIFLIFVSFGIFGYLASAITRFILDGVFRRNLKDYRIVRSIEKLKGHVIVCGYGRNGKQACLELIEHGENVVVIDSEESSIDRIRLQPELLFVQGDATQEDVLNMANIATAKALITAIPNDAENVYVVLTAREMNSKIKIISRSEKSQSDNKLKRAGADNVIMPDRIGGQQMAKLVAQPDVVEFLDNILLQSTKGVKLEEVSCRGLAECFVGKSIRELNVRDRSGANIIGLKDQDGVYIYNPSPEIVLDRYFHLFVLGNKEQVYNLKQLLVVGE